MEPDITTTQPGGSAQDQAIFSALQSSLLDSADLVSSADSGIESAISSAIQGINQSRDAQANRVNSTASEQARNIQRSGLIAQTDAVEGRRGFATQTAVLRNILNTTNQELKDLETRRQDLLATGEAEAASQVAQLQVQSLQLAQEAKQNAISNMINTANSMFNFRRLQNDEAQQARSNALEAIENLETIGTLQNLDPDQLAGLEENAGLPAGSLSDIPGVPTDYEFRQVGSSLLAVDPNDPSDVTVVYNEPASATGSGGGRTLTIADTQELGLPLGMAGIKEADLIASLESNSVPGWFREAEQTVSFATLAPNVLENRWNQFKGELLGRSGVPSSDPFDRELEQALEVDPVQEILSQFQ